MEWLLYLLGTTLDEDVDGLMRKMEFLTSQKLKKTSSGREKKEVLCRKGRP